MPNRPSQARRMIPFDTKIQRTLRRKNNNDGPETKEESAERLKVDEENALRNA